MVTTAFTSNRPYHNIPFLEFSNSLETGFSGKTFNWQPLGIAVIAVS